MGELSLWHWLIVAGVAMLMFGTNRLPDAARAIGRSLRVFQSEMHGVEDHGGTAVIDGAARAVGEQTADAPPGGPTPPADKPGTPAAEPAVGATGGPSDLGGAGAGAGEGSRGSAEPGGDARARAE